MLFTTKIVLYYTVYFKRNKLMTLARQHWQYKHASGLCGAGKTMLMWSEWSQSKYSRYNCDGKDAENVLPCQGQGATEQRHAGCRL